MEIRKMTKTVEDTEARKYGNSTGTWKAKFPRRCSSYAGSIKSSKSRRAHASRRESPGKRNGIDGPAKVLKCLIENVMGIKKKSS